MPWPGHWPRPAEHEQAAAIASRAETVARSITDPYWQARALTAVAGALARAGQHEQAETMARSITDPDRQARALTAVAGTLAQAGQYEQAAAIASRAETVARAHYRPGLAGAGADGGGRGAGPGRPVRAGRRDRIPGRDGGPVHH